MFQRGFQYILEAFICWNFLIIDAYGSCDMINRIKNRDVGINVTATESPCRMIVRSNDDRQVVAVIYNFQRNCIESGEMTISDGSLINNTIINRNCRPKNLSYASRNHGLIIKLTSPFQAFDIDLYVINTDTLYDAQQGTIVSPRYPGSDGGYTTTTPNNYYGIYRIISLYNVSIYLSFTEFRVQPSPGGVTSICNRDVVKVLTDNTFRAEYCGDGIIPHPINVRAKMLTLEFFTDDFATYTGFTASYSVCIQEVNASQSNGPITFPRFPSIKRSCIFIIRLQERGRIQLHLDSYPNLQRNCSQYITIFKDGKLYEFSACDGSLVLHAREIRVAFDLDNGEAFEGNYSIDLSTSEQDQTTLSSASNDKTPDDPAIIVGVSVAVIVVVIAFTFTIIVAYRRKNLTFKACRTTEAGSHTSRDQVNLQSNNSEAHYEGPIVPISDNNYSVPDQHRVDNKQLEDAYDDIGISTKDQGSYYNVPVSNTSASQETSGGYYNTSASGVTYNNQQEHMYEGTLVDLDIDKQTYSKLYN